MSRFWPAHHDIGGAQLNRGVKRQPSATMQVSVSPAAVCHHPHYVGDCGRWSQSSASSIECPAVAASSIQHPASSIQHPASSIQHSACSLAWAGTLESSDPQLILTTLGCCADTYHFGAPRLVDRAQQHHVRLDSHVLILFYLERTVPKRCIEQNHF